MSINRSTADVDDEKAALLKDDFLLPPAQQGKKYGGDGQDVGFFGGLKRRLTPEHSFTYYVKYWTNPKNSFLLILTGALILVGTCNRVFFKKMLIPMVNYPYFVSQLTTTVTLTPSLQNSFLSRFFFCYISIFGII